MAAAKEKEVKDAGPSPKAEAIADALLAHGLTNNVEPIVGVALAKHAKNDPDIVDTVPELVLKIAGLLLGFFTREKLTKVVEEAMKEDKPKK